MIISSSKEYANKFYIPLTKNHRGSFSRVQIFSSVDIDSICAVKILLHLFQCDDIRYSLAICRNISEIVDNFKGLRDTCKNLVLINCGATDDLVALLNPTDQTRIFVIDSRRPIHLSNLYSNRQVRLLAFVNPDEPPRVDDVFSNVPDKNGNDRYFYAEYDLAEDAEDEEEDEENRQSRYSRLEFLQKRRDWNKNRRAILFQYNKFQSYHGSSAVKMFELAHILSKDDHDLFFWGVLGLCDMHMQQKISREVFVTESVALQGHVIRLKHTIDPENLQSFRISYTQDLSLRFYRQWNVFDSLCNSPYTASIFRTWETKGQRVLYELLADMGFSLAQCKQNYSAMDNDIRNSMTDWFREKADKYNIPNVIDATFMASYGFNQKIQVCDVALGLFATVTMNEDSSSLEENFHTALNELSKSEVTQRLPSILELGKKQLLAMRQVVQTAFEEKLFIGMNNYLQVCLDNLSSATSKFIGRPEVLVPLAHFLQQTYVVMTRGKKIKSVPFVLVASIFPPSGEVSEWLHIVGLPAHEFAGKMNFMGHMFQEAAFKSKTEIVQDSYDNFIVRIKKSNKITFLDALITVIASS